VQNDFFNIVQEEFESLEDASNEIMLAEDDEALRCRWGEVFLHIPKDDLDTELDARKESVQASKAALEAERAAALAEMARLKTVLTRNSRTL